MTSRSGHGFLVDLSRLLSHALRHEPWVYELELDDDGWAPLDQLLVALRSRGGRWSNISRDHIEEVIRHADKKRHQLEGDRIRALYGHSLPGRLVRERARPPDVLFHGTSPKAISEILRIGLMPMGRQYVHLSVDRTTAMSVGCRKDRSPVILLVEALRAHDRNIAFYCGNEHVWLANTIPAEFISVIDQ